MNYGKMYIAAVLLFLAEGCTAGSDVAETRGEYIPPVPMCFTYHRLGNSTTRQRTGAYAIMPTPRLRRIGVTWPRR